MGVWLQRGLGSRGELGRMQAARPSLWAGKVDKITNTTEIQNTKGKVA